MNERQKLWLGALLVTLQFGLLAVLAWLALPAVEKGAIHWAAWAAVVGAVLLIVWTFRVNRIGNFNIHPKPKAGGTLITTGPYGWIRHPMYTAFLLGTWALAWTADTEWAWLGWWTLSLVLWVKSQLEERWMLAQHPEYAHYREQTKRFLPCIF